MSTGEFITRYALPRFIVRGQVNTLTMDVYNAAGTQQTASVGTITLKTGSKVLVDAASVTSLGPPASYTLPAATTTDEALADDLIEIWTLTLSGEPDVSTFQRPAYLVRRVYVPTVTDTDLIDRHSELTAWLAARTDITSYQKYRDEANAIIQTDLLSTGRRPFLIFDPWSFRLPHIYKTLELIFTDSFTSIGNGKYQRLMEHYRATFERTWGKVTARMDSDHSGDISAAEQERDSAVGSVSITAGPRYRRSYSR
jgi:hypothetical protein